MPNVGLISLLCPHLFSAIISSISSQKKTKNRIQMVKDEHNVHLFSLGFFLWIFWDGTFYYLFSNFHFLLAGIRRHHYKEDRASSGLWNLWGTSNSWTMQHGCWEVGWLPHWSRPLKPRSTHDLYYILIFTLKILWVFSPPIFSPCIYALVFFLQTHEMEVELFWVII